VTNDEKYSDYKKKKIIRYIIIILSLLTITLESLALFGMISYVWGLIPFSLTYIIKYLNVSKFDNKKNKDNQKK